MAPHQEWHFSASGFDLGLEQEGLVHFLTYVILGLQSLEAGTGGAALTMLQSPQPPPIESLLINLINDVIRIPRDIALILDDYHLGHHEQYREVVAGFLKEHL